MCTSKLLICLHIAKYMHVVIVETQIPLSLRVLCYPAEHCLEAGLWENGEWEEGFQPDRLINQY